MNRGRRWRYLSVEIVFVGLPFSAFKALTGVIALRTSTVVGGALVALGTVDLAMNVVNLLSLLFWQRRAVDVCLLDFAVRRLDRNAPTGDLGIALDVFLSFGLVAAVVGLGMIAKMPSWALPIWNVAVVLNVLGAGAGRLYSALQRRLPGAP